MVRFAFLALQLDSDFALRAWLLVVMLAPLLAYLVVRRTATYKFWFVGTDQEPAFASLFLKAVGVTIMVLIAIGAIGLVVVAIVLWAWRTIFHPLGS